VIYTRSHRDGEGEASGERDVQALEGLQERLLRLARQSALGSSSGRRPASGKDYSHSQRQQRDLWCSEDPLRAEDALGVRCARKRVARLMREASLFGCGGRRRKARTTLRSHTERTPPAPDLVKRNFTPEAPDRLWVADISYVRTWEGWLYLSFVLDTYSRRIVGWSMANNLKTELVLDALNMAIYNRRPQPGLIHHSDQGSQYTSVEFGSRLKEAGLLPSMGSVADAYDNSMAESFVSTLKRELIHRHSWPNRQRPQGRRSSSTSRASTTPAEGTPRSDTSAPQSTRKLE
jgi:transposase InsO family protein